MNLGSFFFFSNKQWTVNLSTMDRRKSVVQLLVSAMRTTNSQTMTTKNCRIGGIDEREKKTQIKMKMNKNEQRKCNEWNTYNTNQQEIDFDFDFDFISWIFIINIHSTIFNSGLILWVHLLFWLLRRCFIVTASHHDQSHSFFCSSLFDQSFIMHYAVRLWCVHSIQTFLFHWNLGIIEQRRKCTSKPKGSENV